MNAAEFARRRDRIEFECHGRGKRYAKCISHLVRDARAAIVVMERKIVGYRLPNGQIVCMKSRYKDEAQALDSMGHIQADNVGHRVPVRAYYCRRCFGFHLTSQQRNITP